MPLANAAPVGFIPTNNPEAARPFYEVTLGLPLRLDDGFALVFSLGVASTMLRVVRTGPFNPQPFTIFGWEVPDLAAAIEQLTSKRVLFLRFDFLPQGERGIWTAPTGDQIAWFKDPDGNTLSLSQHTQN